MDTTMKLELKFKTSEGKTRTLSVNQPTLGLEPTLVQEAMEAIAAQNIFEQEDVQLYNQVQSARYVTRSTNDLFEVAEV
ncbi:MAG: DUF2922 domain-containing protein [Alkalibacterium sp.]|nr:DUF2922 domain-containing protein [Alkalibacterium sp.]